MACRKSKNQGNTVRQSIRNSTVEPFVSGKAHLREALVLHEESQRLQRMCRDLKAKQALAKVLKRVQESTVESYSGIGDEEDFRGLLDPPDIIGKKRDIDWSLISFPGY